MDHARTIQAPGASRKRKERDSFHSPVSLNPLVKPTAVNSTRQAKPSPKGAEPSVKPMQQTTMSSNRLLAGYLAHEFLTKGTLFGEKFDPARGESVQMNASNKQVENQRQASSEAEPNGKSKPHGYMEVANLLKSDGAHISGVVNPTQLARWIQM